MMITKWYPFDGLFDHYPKVASGDWVPLADISESDQAYRIRLELADVDKEDVRVKVKDKVLTIQGERKQHAVSDGEQFVRIERHTGSFYRSFALPDNADETQIDASYKNGVLQIEIAKVPEQVPKAIEVKVA